MHRMENVDLARRHVAEARGRIDRQREIIERLQAGRHPTDLAEQLLASLLETADHMQAHLDMLEATNGT
jgi:hypothetical protein